MNDTFKHSYKVEHFEYVGLAVYNCGIQKCEEGYSWGPAVRDHYLIHYILSGKGSYETGGQRYELTAGDGFLAFPSTTGQTEPIPGNIPGWVLTAPRRNVLSSWPAFRRTSRFSIALWKARWRQISLPFLTLRDRGCRMKSVCAAG